MYSSQDTGGKNNNKRTTKSKKTSQPHSTRVMHREGVSGHTSQMSIPKADGLLYCGGLSFKITMHAISIRE